MNKQEAELKQAELLDEQAMKFCPLARKLCDPKCVCLVNNVRNVPSDSNIYVINIYCNNPMFQYLE